MLNGGGVVYEVSFDVDDDGRFEEWFPETYLEWSTLPGTDRVRTFRGIDGEREWIRVRFCFDRYEDWRSFVQQETHQDAMAMLEHVSSSVETALWRPSAVRISGGGAAVVDEDAVGAAASAPEDVGDGDGRADAGNRADADDGTDADGVSMSVSDVITEP